jgi:uncharacterized protein (TIGR02147 family)
MNIYEFTDYRQFLRQFYEEKKESNGSFSFRAMGLKLDLDAGFLVKVMNRQFHMRPKSFDKLFALCRFNEREQEYFETLVLFAKAKEEREVKTHFEKLLSIKGVSSFQVEDYQYEYYQQWYHSAIRAICNFCNFTGTEFKKIGDSLSPRITAKECKESVTLLLRLNLIEKNSDGFIRPTENLITTAPEIRTVAIRHFQRSTMALAMESLERHEPAIRDISSVTVSLNEDAVERVRAKIKECRESVLSIAKESPIEDRVCQLNIQFFPLTEAIGGNNG